MYRLDLSQKVLASTKHINLQIYLTEPNSTLATSACMAVEHSRFTQWMNELPF